jgi:hypothetical protein
MHKFSCISLIMIAIAGRDLLAVKGLLNSRRSLQHTVGAACCDSRFFVMYLNQRNNVINRILSYGSHFG